MSAPTSSGYIGMAFEIPKLDGISLTVGWQPVEVDRLASGLTVGQSFSDKTVPTRSGWKLDHFAGGISIDSSIASKLLRLAKGG